MIALTRADIEADFAWPAIEVSVREALMAWVERRAIVPERTVIRTEQRGGEVLTMPGYLPDHAVVGVKVWSRFELDRGPETSATILYRDLVRGTEVVIDGTLITELRTSVMSVVASRHLARSDARTVAIVGAGRQGRAHLDAFAALMPIERIIVTSRRSETRDHLVVQAQSANPHMRIESWDDPEKAALAADILVLATTASSPPVADSSIRPGTFVCGVGSHARDASEIDLHTVARAGVVAVDTIAGAVDGAGDIQAAIEADLIAREDVVELGFLVTGRHRGRQSDRSVTVFKSAGFAGLDLAVASQMAQTAIGRGAGTWVDLHG